MREASFPKPVAEVVTTLADIFRHQGRTGTVELLERAHAWFDNVDYDNWNGGTYSWAFRLEVPVSVFASIEPHLPDVEKEILTKLAYCGRLFPNDPITAVTVSPFSPAGAVGQRIAPSDVEVRRLWPENRFRLFLSHVSKHKIAVSKLKGELELHGVAPFVAHEDIEPTFEWEHEIELALRSMHALVALITPDFHGSSWTDQEVGWAFGRGLLVVPVRLGCDPYGLLGKVQGVSGSLAQPGMLASAIVDALLANNQTHGEMRRTVVSAFAGATSLSMATALCQHAIKIPDFTDEEKDALQTACVENIQISSHADVAEAIYNVFGRPPAKTGVANEEDVPF